MRYENAPLADSGNELAGWMDTGYFPNPSPTGRALDAATGSAPGHQEGRERCSEIANRAASHDLQNHLFHMQRLLLEFGRQRLPAMDHQVHIQGI